MKWWRVSLVAQTPQGEVRKRYFFRFRARRFLGKCMKAGWKVDYNDPTLPARFERAAAKAAAQLELPE